MLHPLTVRALALALCAPLVWGAQPKFEVASIRPVGGGPPVPPPPPPPIAGALPPPPPPPGGVCFPRPATSGNRVDRPCTSLNDLLLEVFDVPQSRLIAPDWITGPRFDISAKMPEGAMPEQIPAMIESLLEDRFGMRFHRETKEGLVNVLVVAKGGSKLKPALPDSEQPAWVAAALAASANGPYGNGHIGTVWFRSLVMPGADGSPVTVWQAPSFGVLRRVQVGGLEGVVRYEAPSVSPEGLALVATLAGNGVDSPIVDMTGLTRRYQVNLDISMADLLAELRANPGDLTAAHNAEFHVVQEGLKKLGLDLQQRKGMVEQVVIDHLEKTPTEN